MKRKSIVVLSISLIAASIAVIASVVAAPSTPSIPSIPVTESSDVEVEVPNVKFITEQMSSNGHIGNTSALVNETNTLHIGEGISGFNFKAPSSGTEIVRVYVNNIGKTSLSYKLISPKSTNWIADTIEPGGTWITEHVFGKEQAGMWNMKFVTKDGSEGIVEIFVVDGINS